MIYFQKQNLIQNWDVKNSFMIKFDSREKKGIMKKVTGHNFIDKLVKKIFFFPAWHGNSGASYDETELSKPRK